MSLSLAALVLGCDARSPGRDAAGEAGAESGYGSDLEARTESEVEAGGDGSRPQHGRFRRLRRGPVDPASEGLLEELRALGYLGATNLASTDRVVTVHADGAADGFGLYTSGHGPEAYLIDRSGRELHRWRKEIHEVWPDAPPILPRRHYFRDAVVYPNGDLLTLYSDSVKGLLKLDRDSNLLWANGELGTHHAVEPLPNGDAYVLTRVAHVVPLIDERAPILEDFITRVDSRGAVQRQVSLIEALARSPYWSRWERRARRCRGKFATRGDCADVFHTNSLQVLDGRFADRLPAFRAGNILTSFRRLDSIAVVDMEREEVVWMLSGRFRAQHDPRLLDNGNILVFDNQGRRDASSVQEIDPLTGEVVWEYRGTDRHPFYTQWCGAAARLPNGNTLITESENGRAFEVTPAREIVWEYHSPHRAGDDAEYVGVLFEMIHLPPDFPIDWTHARRGARPPGAAPAAR